MKLELYFHLGTTSRRAFKRVSKSFNRPYNYNPRGDLLLRLSRETGLSVEQVYKQLQKERIFYLQQLN